MAWTRRATVIDGTTCENDWIVSRDGEEVGRVLLMISGPGIPMWKWASWIIPAHHGLEETRDAALDALRQEVLRQLQT